MQNLLLMHREPELMQAGSHLLGSQVAGWSQDVLDWMITVGGEPLHAAEADGKKGRVIILPGMKASAPGSDGNHRSKGIT